MATAVKVDELPSLELLVYQVPARSSPRPPQVTGPNPGMGAGALGGSTQLTDLRAAASPETMGYLTTCSSAAGGHATKSALESEP